MLPPNDGPETSSAIDSSLKIAASDHDSQDYTGLAGDSVVENVDEVKVKVKVAETPHGDHDGCEVEVPAS